MSDNNIGGIISFFLVIIILSCAISNCCNYYRKSFNNAELNPINTINNSENDEDISIDPPPRYEDVPEQSTYQSNDQTPPYDTVIRG